MMLQVFRNLERKLCTTRRKNMEEFRGRRLISGWGRIL
jgi:hypothetical protein